MTDDGTKLYDVVKQVRIFFVEIARMLNDCDRLMSEHGWESIGTGSISGSSASINIAEKWLPHAINRIYTKEGLPRITKVVATILDDEWQNRVSEPIIVGSTYSTVEEKFIAFHGWDHTWWWLELTDAVPDGQIKTIDAQGRERKEFERFTDLKLFGCPMAAITNADLIKDRVVDILVGI